jgi:hypothetical protein
MHGALEFLRHVYTTFGFTYNLKLSTRYCGRCGGSVSVENIRGHAPRQQEREAKLLSSSFFELKRPTRMIHFFELKRMNGNRRSLFVACVYNSLFTLADCNHRIWLDLMLFTFYHNLKCVVGIVARLRKCTSRTPYVHVPGLPDGLFSNQNLGKFWRVLQWKMLVYFMDT